MTEQQWLASADPAAMLEFLRGANFDRATPSLRRLRLLACAFHSDMDLPGPESYCLNLFYAQIDKANPTVPPAYRHWFSNPGALIRGNIPQYECERRERQVAIIRDIFGNPFRPMPRWNTCPCEGDYCTNPSCDWGNAPSWLTWNGGIIPATAARLYDSRDFSEMPVLADMLIDAGCQNEEILMHCLRPTMCSRGEECKPHYDPHVKGCWVIDLLLGLS